MVIGVNCGHTLSGTPGSGAKGYLNESDETRVVGRKLMEYLRSAGHTVVDCTNDIAGSASENLAQIVDLANRQNLDRFYSIHFNAGRGQGAEAFTMSGKDTAMAQDILSGLESIGFKDRGIKKGSHLYVVRRTNAPAVLIEVCFVDTESDVALYKKVGADKIAKVLAEAITGENINAEEKLTMAQYEELKQEIKDLTETVKVLATEVHNLKNPMVYNYIDDNMPEWARPTITKLMDKGFLKGDEEGRLNLDENMLRMLVINDRAGVYGCW